MQSAIAVSGVSSVHALGRPSRSTFCKRASCRSYACSSLASCRAIGASRESSACSWELPLPERSSATLSGERFGENFGFVGLEAREGSSSVARRWQELGRVAILFLGSSALLLAAGLNACRPARAQEAVEATAATTVEKVEESSDDRPGLSEKFTSKLPKPLSEEEEEEIIEQLGRLHEMMEKREMEAAVELLNKLIEKTPYVLEFRFIRGHAYEYMSNYEMATKDFEEVLQIDPLSLRGLQGLALVLKKQGKDISFIEKTVEEAAREASEQDRPKDARNFRMLLGQLLTLKEDLTQALQHYEELSKEDPTDFRPYLCRGLVCCILGDMEQAEKHFADFDKRCPKTMGCRDMLEDLITKARAEAETLVERRSK